MKNLFLLLIVLFAFRITYSQFHLQKTFIDTNYYSFSDVLEKNSDLSIFFFCPTRNIDTTEYMSKINDFISDLEIQKTQQLNINVIFFTESGKSHSGGMKVKTRDSTYFISEIECYIANYVPKNLQRANKFENLIRTYKSKSIKEQKNLCRVEIIDEVICFKRYSDRIKFYGDFIYEVIAPNYSDREIIEFLRKEIDVLNAKVAKLEQEYSKIDQGCKNK